VGSNVEIKARVRDAAALRLRIQERTASAPEVLRQEDTFFRVPRGRLKLRELGPGEGQLIYYERPDAPGPKRSDYRIAATHRPEDLREVLAAALGILGQVRKRRQVFLIGQTRVHLDEVEGLGTLAELEVVLATHQSTEDGERVARELMARLGIAAEDLVDAAYVDLLLREARGPR
jgi:predicted adenylyl cyclase CyaB